MDREETRSLDHGGSEEGDDEVSLAKCHRGVQLPYELDRHCQPAAGELSAGPLDEAAEVVVVFFYLGYRPCIGECIQDL